VDDLLDIFATLFSGRTDAYGSWEGGCERSPVSRSTYAKHLWGQEYVGIYPLTDDDCVTWGCADIDTPDIDQARNIQMAFAVKGIDSWIERTVKGYHVWVFADGKVPAATMRRAMLVAYSVVHAPAKEINPKQERARGLGNYVRLPYPGACLELPSSRYMLANDESPYPLKEFVSDAYESRAKLAQLTPLAEMWRPRRPAEFIATGEMLTPEAVKTMLAPYSLRIYLEGPLEGADRSTTLVRFAYKMRAEGQTPEMAYAILRSADARWGKFWAREDGEEHLAKIISDVYGD
jgi:hypothetical protein